MVNKYFPQLVASVVEKLNGKNQTALTYMYRDHLTNTYSQDGRWASITAEYTRVAADVVSMDAELPLKSRDKVSTAEGQIPKVGMKLYMSEKQLKDLDNMIAQRLPQPQICVTCLQTFLVVFRRFTSVLKICSSVSCQQV